MSKIDDLRYKCSMPGVTETGDCMSNRTDCDGCEYLITTSDDIGERTVNADLREWADDDCPGALVMARIKLTIPDEFVPEIKEIRNRISAGRLMQANGAYMEAQANTELWDKVREIMPEIPTEVNLTFDHMTYTVIFDANIEESE